MSKTRQSTQEEIDARRIEVAATRCPGDTVHLMPDHHDWRLHKRNPRYHPNGKAALSWPLVGHDEQWYCTRCRRIEERTVLLDGS